MREWEWEWERGERVGGDVSDVEYDGEEEGEDHFS